MFQNDLKQFVEDNPKLVKMRPAGDGIYVLKYSKSVFFRGCWNEYLENCRGTIVDRDFNVVSRPFTKIYNFGVEAQAPVIADHELVTAYRKVNGFMVSVTWHNGDVLVSTTGSTDSDFVRMAKEMMLKHKSWTDWQIEVCGVQGTTLMFECVHPDDPHICPEKAGMYFLGYRANTWDSQIQGFGHDIAEHWRDYATGVLNCYAPESWVLTMGELVERSKTADHEGFVCYTADGRATKIKTRHYLVQKALARKKDILSLNKELIDEEYYPLFEHLMSKKDEFNSWDEQVRLAYMRDFLESA
jgi:hypothetical protein